jgi:hypothetical protein
MISFKVNERHIRLCLPGVDSLTSLLIYHMGLCTEDIDYNQDLQDDELGLTEVNDDIGGIFGIPKMDGEFHAVIDGGFKEGVDEQTVNIFTPPVQVQFEQLRARMEDAEGAKVKAEKEYSNLIENQQSIKREQLLLNERDKLVEEEIKHILNLEAEHRKFLKGPPRRMESEKQKEENHLMKLRRFALQKERGELERKKEKLSSDYQANGKKELGIARKVAILRER